MRSKWIQFKCGAGFIVDNDYMPKEDITSKNCKLFAVTYAIKNERESIHFIPKEMEEKQ